MDVTDFSDVAGVDIGVPNAARMYDYYLGGSHNFESDRGAAEMAKKTMPWIADAVRANRAFLARAVRYCQSRGVDQFLDLGSGIPTVGNVHEIARETNPDARVAYVDNEAVTVACSALLLEGDPLATVSSADMTDPQSVLAAPGVAGLLDFSRPVALLTVAVLHFVPDERDPAGIAAAYRSRLAPGSFHVLSHVTADHDPEAAEQTAGTYTRSANPIWPRPKAAITALFGDAELVEPGLVDASDWRPASNHGPEHVGFYAGVGRIGPGSA